MIDLFTILFSTVMTVYIILRAAKLNRVLPWFETKSLYEQTMKKQEEAKQAAQRRRGGVITDPRADRAAMLRR